MNSFKEKELIIKSFNDGVNLTNDVMSGEEYYVENYVDPVKISLEKYYSVEITMGNQIVTIKMINDDDSLMLFNNREYTLHEGYIFNEDGNAH